MASQAESTRMEGSGQSDSELLGARLRQLSELELLPDRNRVLLAEAAEKLASATVYVAVVGDFKRGKSSLINALLGAPLLPVGVVPLTAHPTLVRYGPEPIVLVTQASGTERVALDRLAEFVTEQANPGNRLKVREVWVEYPSPLLREGVVVVDTPGTGSFYEHNTDAAQSFLPRIDVGVVVLTTESPLSLSEARWMRDVAGRAARIAVCINKVDTISAHEQAEVLAFVQVGVARIVGDRPTPFFMTSARRELEEGGDEGVASLRRWLLHDLGDSRSRIAWDSAARAGSSALELARSALALERAALSTPVADARDHEQRVLAAQVRLVRVGNEGRAVITAQATDLIRNTVDPQVDAIRADLGQRLLALSDDHDWPQETEAMVNQAGSELEALVREPLQRALIDQADRLQGVLNEFLAEVGEIYRIRLPDAPRLADPARLPSVRVTIDDEPGAVAMGLRSLRRVLPGTAGRSWRERGRRQEAEQAADRLAGRLRYATVSAVDEAVREWLAWSDAEWRGLAEALSAALRRSAAAAAAGEAAAKSEEARLEGLAEFLALVAEALRPQAVTPRDPSAAV
ncbi:MAG: dynamin family protein [Candidatus Dormiibacterota bacterium]